MTMNVSIDVQTASDRLDAAHTEVRRHRSALAKTTDAADRANGVELATLLRSKEALQRQLGGAEAALAHAAKAFHDANREYEEA